MYRIEMKTLEKNSDNDLKNINQSKKYISYIFAFEILHIVRDI